MATSRGQVFVVVGAQWGDEGKGKLIDLLAGKFDICARAAGGSNAGHTVVVDGVKYCFHLLPSGILAESSTAVIGNGVVVHVPSLLEEVDTLAKQGVDCFHRIKLSDRAHLLFDYHMIIDGLREHERGGGKIGTTRKGIGPCYSSKANRTGLRVGDLRNFRAFPAALRRALASKYKRFYPFEYDTRKEVARYYEYAKQLETNTVDTVSYLDACGKAKQSVLIEGANAALLDIDFGTYPYVTSSNCTIGGICTGLGLAPKRISTTCGVVKAYTTRVGEGPFPTELHDDHGKQLQVEGREFGSTTGRPRRCGWLDTFIVNYTNSINGYDSVCLTKLDVLSGFDQLKIGTGYSIAGRKLTYYPESLKLLGEVEVEYETMPGWKEHADQVNKARKFSELPEAAQKYVKRVEELIGVPIKYIGVGAARDAIIVCD